MTFSNKTNIIADVLTPFAFESITVNNTAKRLSAGTYTDNNGNFAQKALITVEDAQIRFRYDGESPTSAVGHLCGSNDTIYLTNTNEIRDFRATRVSSTNATLRVSYVK